MAKKEKNNTKAGRKAAEQNAAVEAAETETTIVEKTDDECTLEELAEKYDGQKKVQRAETSIEIPSAIPGGAPMKKAITVYVLRPDIVRRLIEAGICETAPLFPDAKTAYAFNTEHKSVTRISRKATPEQKAAKRAEKYLRELVAFATEAKDETALDGYNTALSALLNAAS